MRSSINSGYRGERRVLNFPHIVFAFNFMTGLLNKQYYSRGLSGRERNFSFYIFDVLKLPVKKKMWVSSNVFQCSNFFQLKKNSGWGKYRKLRHLFQSSWHFSTGKNPSKVIAWKWEFSFNLIRIVYTLLQFKLGLKFIDSLLCPTRGRPSAMFAIIRLQKSVYNRLKTW